MTICEGREIITPVTLNAADSLAALVAAIDITRGGASSELCAEKVENLFGSLSANRAADHAVTMIKLCSVANDAAKIERNLMTNKSAPHSTARTPITPAAASRIQAATAKGNGGSVPKGSFAATAQSVAAKGGKR